MSHDFQSLKLRPELLAALSQIGYVEMTPIQAMALPHMLAGKDVTGHAKTGSGKTAAFGLGLLQRLDPKRKRTQAMVLCPTRELSDQVAAELRRLAQRMSNTRIVTVCGGRPYREQVVALRAGCHVVVGTPGRVGQHLRNGHIRLESLGVLVLDEADRMLDMGFMDQVNEIVRACPRKRRTLLFSATFPEAIERLIQEVQRTPEHVLVDEQAAPDEVNQLVFFCDREQRLQTVADILGAYRPATALVFAETRDDCAELASFLQAKGASALPLHGGMEQTDREDALLQFSNGSACVLVSTNVASRGLDIPALPMVIISELTKDAESHLHRIGRTGRAGEAGQALSIVSGPREKGRLRRTEEFLGESIPPGPELEATEDLGFLTPPYRTILMDSGRRDKLRKGDLLGSLVKEGGIPPDAIGQIDLMQKYCAVAIKNAFVEKALAHLKRGRVKKMQVKAILL